MDPPDLDLPWLSDCLLMTSFTQDVVLELRCLCWLCLFRNKTELLLTTPYEDVKTARRDFMQAYTVVLEFYRIVIRTRRGVTTALTSRERLTKMRSPVPAFAFPTRDCGENISATAA